MLLKALSSIVLILAVAAFCMTVAANFRSMHYHELAISQIAQENMRATTTSAPYRARLLDTEDQRAAKLESAAVSKGEIWFLFSKVAWIAIGCVLLVPGIALTAVMRVQRAKQTKAAGETADKQPTAP